MVTLLCTLCRYKAGALSYGMKLFGDSIDYVAVFDSDFQPSPSFLRDLIPYLVANPTVGWVQVGAAWVLASAGKTDLVLPGIPQDLAGRSGCSCICAGMMTLLLCCRAAGSSQTPTSRT